MPNFKKLAKGYEKEAILAYKSTSVFLPSMTNTQLRKVNHLVKTSKKP